MYEKEITLWPSTASHSSISNFYLALGTAVPYRDYLRFFTGYSKENDTGFFSAFCLSTSAVSLCIAYLCGVFAWGMRPCVKEQTGGEEKLPSEFNLRWGTKYPLLLIPRSDFGRYKKKNYLPFQLSLFAFVLTKYPALEILLNFFNSSPGFIALVQCLLQTAI